ncbi:MAG: CoA-binding protein [Bacteroidetes bacterium]|nr:CoA-binding protein [Bacteroidota bacterium]
MSETVLVLGASENPLRYSHMATLMLLEYGHKPVLIGKTGDKVQGIRIHRTIPEGFTAVDTITLYINPLHQQAWYNTIVSLNPGRVIFNPGTENPEFAALLTAANIPYLQACTLVMLRAGQF